MTRRLRSTFPSEAELAKVIMDIRTDALAILPMYHRLHGMGVEAERGESVHVSGGGVGDPTGTVAIDAERAKHYREYARYVAVELGRLARKVDRLKQGLEHNIGPTPGYRQPQSIGSDAIVSELEFAQSVEKQRGRLKQGAE